jgi:hypothetical protein
MTRRDPRPEAAIQRAIFQLSFGKPAAFGFELEREGHRLLRGRAT